MGKDILTVSLLSSILLLFNGCDREMRAHKLPLTLDVVDRNVCLYTKSKNSFLDENHESSYFLVWVKSFEKNAKGYSDLYDRKITLQEHSFPFKKKDCILIPIELFELNKPHGFGIETGKTFYQRACIIREGNNYRIKKVHSTENCDE